VDPWPGFVAAVLVRHGVADVAMAGRHGVSANRFYRRTAVEGWGAPAARVRIHPDAPRSLQRSLIAVCSSTRDLAAASRDAAAWLHGLERHPPGRATVLGRHATQARACDGVVVHRARWLAAEDVIEIDGIPTLGIPAMLLSACAPPHAERAVQMRGRLIDAVHRGLTTPEAVLSRLERVGPVAGKGTLRGACERLVRWRIESVFQDEVAAELDRLGYRPGRSTLRIPTADGVGLEIDVPLATWQVAVEPDGDRFHRTREQRRSDRRREAAFAGSGWVRVPVDWRDWALDREHVLAAIDAAIDAQRRRGVGAAAVPPRRGPRSGD
jgi:hypothetical protein